MMPQHDRVHQDKDFKLSYVIFRPEIKKITGDNIFHLSSYFWYPVAKMPEPLISSKKVFFWSNFIFTVMGRG